MNKWIVFLLGIITGALLTWGFDSLDNKKGLDGLKATVENGLKKIVEKREDVKESSEDVEVSLEDVEVSSGSLSPWGFEEIVPEKILFDEPGDCVSWKNFEVQEVLESGDAIALEISTVSYGYVITSDLKVLILAQEGSHFYDKQIVKAPRGKCARHIGNYKYGFKNRNVIPIVAFK